MPTAPFENNPEAHLPADMLEAHALADRGAKSTRMIRLAWQLHC